MESYPNITKMLHGDKNLSLDLYFFSMSGGIDNIRIASIFEPNPNAGKTAGEGDQTYVLGKRHLKRGYDFKARDINEALELLERTCSGETSLKDTIGNDYDDDDYGDDSWPPRINVVNGYEEPKGGLDNWIFAGIQLELQKKDKSLVAQVYSRDFYAREALIISSKEVQTVGEAFYPYQEQTLDYTIPAHIQRGSLLLDRLRHYGKFGSNDRLKENTLNILNTEVSREYNRALETLKPLEITSAAKDALLISMLMGKIFA